MPPCSYAAGTVTNADETAFDNALSGGGIVTLAFDGTLTVTYAKGISSDTVIDGTGHNVTISGGNSAQLFSVAGGVTLTLRNVTIADGWANTQGGAIFNNGTVVASGCTFNNNNVAGNNGTAGQNGANHSNNGDNGGAGTAGGSVYGGAIYNLGTLGLSRCLFRSNSVTGGTGGGGGNGGNGDFTGGNGGAGGAGGIALGGAIFSTNNVGITNCSFLGNRATGGNAGSGGAAGIGGAQLGVNGDGGKGGEGSGPGLYTYRGMVVINSTFSEAAGKGGNSTAGGGSHTTGHNGQSGGNSLGGGICNLGTNVTVINCTFYNNKLTGGNGGNGGPGDFTGGNGGAGGTGSGGGLYSLATIGVTNCTFSTNGVFGGTGGAAGSGGAESGSAGGAGAIQGANIAQAGGTFTLKNSILAYKASDGNSFGTITDAGRNISSDNTPTLSGAVGSTNNLDPKLTVLADNGGFTKTCALLSTSPAINNGDSAAAPAQDQRGYYRNVTPDIGAFEYNGIPLFVTLYANGLIASEDGETGLFTIDRFIAAATPLTVTYSISGTASNGIDYRTISNSVTIPANQYQARVFVRPVADALNETNETVILTLIPNTDYQILEPTNALVTILERNNYDRTKRYVRGTGSDPTLQSLVIPVDFEEGVPLAAIGGNATNLFPGNLWTNTLYHYDATNSASQSFPSNRIAFQNPIVAFGERIGGNPLYLNQDYSFGMFAGNAITNLATAIRIQVYNRSNWSFAGTISITLPDVTDTNQLSGFVNSGWTKTVEGFGLRTVLQDTPYQRWALLTPGAYILTHNASSVATNYYYVIENKGAGIYPGEYLVVNQSATHDWSRLYALEFAPRPVGRSTFIDQPHFTASPLPPEYQGKSLEELTNATATMPNLSSLTSSNYLTLDGSPELRRHPTLDKFVSDMGGDPLALANYVINEIELTDAIDYDTNQNSQAAIYLGGVDRSALATYQEGRGSPVEQCALLVYLLRRAGVPAAYVYPTNNGLQMLDSQLSKLLHFQIKGAVNDWGQTNMPHAIAVNYPWVAAYVASESRWVNIFPWLKDVSLIEGLDLYDYMPTNFNSGFKWFTQFILNDTNIFSLKPDSDQPLDLLPRFIQKNLDTYYPGLSVDDMGVKIVNRRHLYTRWDDFPKPFVLSGAPLVIESLKTNLNIFNTIQIRAYSQSDPGKFIDTTELRTADIHNRKVLLKFLQVGTNNVHDMILSLSPYSPTITNQAVFGTNADPTFKLSATNRLASTDDNIKFKVTHRRLRMMAPSYSAPHVSVVPTTNIWGYYYFEQGEQKLGQLFEREDTFRKGDTVAFCLDVGKITDKMLNVHAEEIWRFNRMADTNNPSTLDPDVYQGTTAYLLGMSYFNYIGKFNDFNDRLHKMTFASSFNYGFGLLRPQRDTNGNLPANGVITLVEPAVHMPDNGQSIVFNGTLHPNSGRDFASAHLDWWIQYAVQGSAAEHGVLRGYYQTNAVSTIKLLQLVGTNKVKLDLGNYLAAGEIMYNGKKLKDHDPVIWSDILAFFDTDDYARFTYITPGTVTNGTFRGVGAFLFSGNEIQALISGLNGGFSYQLAGSTFGAPNSVNVTVDIAPDGATSPYILRTGSSLNDLSYLVDGASTSWALPATYNNLAAGVVQLDPSLVQSVVVLQAIYGISGNSAGVYNQYYNLGAGGSAPVAHNDLVQFISDPVSAITGEFYVDDTDLSLPGPMPLQIRRNYGSQNLAENEFGFGWKISYAPFLSLNTNATLIYAAEMDGSLVAYRQTVTNANVWLPQAQDNPTLNNNSSMGIGSVANLFNNRLQLAIVSGTNVYALTGADGSVRSFIQRSYPIGSFSRSRPYLDRWRDSRGNSYTFQYGEDSTQPDYGEVRRIQSSNGNFLGFYYDVYGHILEAYTGDGRRLQYEYDKYADLVTVTRPDQSQLHYEYQHLNYVTNSVTNVYSTHLIVRELKPDGRILKNDYDSQRRVTNQYATVGVDLSPVRNATFAYANNFSLTKPTNLITGRTDIYDYTNNLTSYYYTNSLIRKMVDPLNGTNIQDWFETDTAGGYRRSLKSRTDKRGLQTTFAYDTSGNLTNTTVTGDILGDGSTANVVTSATYNTNNLPLQITDPVGNGVRYVYDTNFPFLPQQTVKFAGATTVSTNFCLYGNATNVASLGSTLVTNVAFGLKKQEIRAYGSADAATADLSCDGRGFVTNTVQYTGTSDPNVTNQFLYNGRGELVQRTDAAGRNYRLSYDPMGRPTANETYEAGQSQPLGWNYSYYNDNGELVWSDGLRFNPEDYIWRDYDGAGRKIQEIHWRSQAKTDGTGVEAPSDGSLYATTFYEHDAFGNLTKVADPLGRYSLKRYDAIGQLLREEFYDTTGALLATNGFAYNTAGDVTNAFNALGGTTQRQYTGIGKPKFQKNPDGSTNAWRYYADGRLRREIQSNGAYWETTYNDAARTSTRIFYTAAGSPLATNQTALDRRGNVIQRTDAGFNTFTTTYDKLDRPKLAAGPVIQTVYEDCGMSPGGGCGVYVTNTVQQFTAYMYDASGRVLTVTNALGEKTVTASDALNRPVSIEIRDAANSVVHVTTTAYSQDHQSVTVTNGSGSSAIVSTAYTDNDGHTVLSIAYPSANVREFTQREYDLVGNLVFEERDSSSNGVLAAWSGAAYAYDGLNRMTSKSDRDAALTTYKYNALGSLTNRSMPGSLQWNAIYNNAGQMTKDWNIGNNGVGTRTNTYAYYTTGNSFAGLLQTRTDGRGVTCTFSYDDFRRNTQEQYSAVYPLSSLTITRTFDARGLLTASSDNLLTITTRAYDAYGQLINEAMSASLLPYVETDQSWDAAGRRTSLDIQTYDYPLANLWPFKYQYNWRADGLLSSVSSSVGSATYAYDSAGVLTNRLVGNRSTTTTSRDGAGRPLTITTKVNTLTKLTETLAYTGDGLLSSHTLDRTGDFTDSRSYSYASLSRRLTEERLNLDATKRWTNIFAYDNETATGPGVLTRVAATTSSPRWNGGTDAFSRIGAETNTARYLLAYGRINGPSTVTANLDGQPVPVTVVDTGDSNWLAQWRAGLYLTPGVHQLNVSATHPGGQFTTNKSVWFTNNAAYERTADVYDAGGLLTQRAWISPAGVTNRTQGFYWDWRGRLYEVDDLDAQQNGYVWTATYDTFDRRLTEGYYGLTNGQFVSLDNYTEIAHFFDPQVEFLELGVSTYNAPGNWKLYGPDNSGVYGGMEGVGGLEAVVSQGNRFSPVVADARGNILGALDAQLTSIDWNSSRPTGYGAVPGYQPVPYAHGVNLVQAIAWRGLWPDITGLYWRGKRFYDPAGGRWMSPDPTWNGRDPNYYSAYGGDPINFDDPNGMFGKGIANGAGSLVTGAAGLLNNTLGALGFAVTSPFAPDWAYQTYGQQAGNFGNAITGIGNLFNDAAGTAALMVSDAVSPGSGDQWFGPSAERTLNVAGNLFGVTDSAGNYNSTGFSVGYSAFQLGTLLAGGELAQAGRAERIAVTAESEGTRLLYHYTTAEESSFANGLWRESSVTDKLYSNPFQASQELGIPVPNKVIPIQDMGQFVPNKPPIVEWTPRYTGGGTDFVNPQPVPPSQLFPAQPIGPR